MAIPVGIVGFRGYSGAELAGILQKHPQVVPVLLEHRDAEDQARPLRHPAPRRLPFSAQTVHTEGLAVVFLATPAEVSLELTLPLL
ncbi:MAG: N-acetyl-gamma-glutamyl-phosphate reductase, partial [Acidobacteriota bacterium]|nr:N-acetyl-gamma-glutamyl-phosphate reductase [Acidobacteriota bacterium]